MFQYLARPLVGAHLQTDGGLVHGALNFSFRVVQVSPGAIGVHPCLAGTLVGPHLKDKNTQYRRSVEDNDAALHNITACFLVSVNMRRKAIKIFFLAA